MHMCLYVCAHCVAQDRWMDVLHPIFITRVLMVSTHHSTGYSLVYLPMYAGYNTYMYMYMYLYMYYGPKNIL